MKTVLKWIGIAAVIVVTLIIIAAPGILIFDPGVRSALIKPTGVHQRKLPSGVMTTLAIENVTVIPMDSEHVLEGYTVVIENGRISDMGVSGEVEIPVDTYVVDGEGQYLIPGLSDMHMHAFGAENDLLLYLANGVTTIRSMGGGPPSILNWRDEINAGSRVGPTIWVWWPSIEDTLSQYADSESMDEFSSRGGVRFVHTPGEAEALVAEVATLGVDGIKAHYIVSSEIYLALLESANEHGLPLDGHIPVDQLDCWDCFRDMEVPAIAHIEELIKIEQGSDEALRQMAQEAADDGLWVTTTLYLMRSIAEQGADLEGALDAVSKEAIYVHPDIFDDRGWALESNYYSDVGSRDFFSGYLDAQERLMPMLNEAGVRLMSGTDTVLAYLVPGFSLHNELETLADVGLSPYDVLKTSTYNPALYLGKLDEFGTIEVGKRADLVLLEANPLEDITNAREIAGVMVRGHWYARADLDAMLELVAQDYESVNTTQSMLKIVFPIVVFLLLIALVWFIVRRRKASQVSS